jgi:hypothetical protein
MLLFTLHRWRLSALLIEGAVTQPPLLRRLCGVLAALKYVQWNTHKNTKS